MKKVVFFALIPAVLVFFVINYLTVPALNLRSVGLWWNFALAAVTYLVFSGIGTDRENRRRAYHKTSYSPVIISGLVLVALLLIIIILSATGWKIWGGRGYSELIQPVEGSFDNDIPKITSESSMVIVDQKTAQKLGDRTIGTLKNAAWYDVDDEYNLIVINGEQYRISPLSYAGFWEYCSASQDGIPGFVLVNAKTQEAELVKTTEGIKYSPSAFWDKDLMRHLRQQFSSKIFGKSFFEVDDELVPYWITSVKEPRVGVFDGMVTVSAIVTNAITGESVEYTIDELPEWVDHVDSIDYLANLVEEHFSLKNGFWNLSKKDVYYPSYHYRNKRDDNEYTPFEGYNSIIATDGRVWFYTGLTPANKAETNVAFLLISPRTGEVRRYNIDGAEESSAQAAAEGLVQNLKYSASFPTIVNVAGEETYFMLLKDAAGLVQRYALCNVKNYTKVAQAESIEEAIKAYKEKMLLDVEDSSDESTTLEVTGVVTKVAQAEIGGYSYFYFMVDCVDGIVFQSSINNSNLQPLKLVEGASVTIQYHNSEMESNVGIVTKISFAQV